MTELPFHQVNAALCRERQQQSEMLDAEQKSVKAMNEQNNVKKKKKKVLAKGTETEKLVSFMQTDRKPSRPLTGRVTFQVVLKILNKLKNKYHH